MCEEVLSISFQFYLGLGNPTVLETDYASPAERSLLILLSNVVCELNTLSSSLFFPRLANTIDCVVNHSEEHIQAKTTPFFLGNS